MSRIGKLPVKVLNGVTVQTTERALVIRGPKGELTFSLPKGFSVTLQGELLTIKELAGVSDSALHGLIRAEIQNAIYGVAQEWSKTLELSGVGYRATMNGDSLVLTLGFSHPVTINPPTGIKLSVTEGKIIVSGISKQLVGQVAAQIRAVKKPEPYKGKGIKYIGEFIRKKAGKAAKAIGGAGSTGGK